MIKPARFNYGRPNSAASGHARRALVLAGIAIVSVALWQTTIGSLLLYPFTILATWFHEMGHGIAAMLTGSSFERLLIFADGSGLALTSRSADRYRLVDALISAGGPLGPAITGALLIISSRREAPTRTALTVLGAALLLSTVIWVRSLVGWLVLPAFGLAILSISRRGSMSTQRFVVQLLGVQACISVWRQFDYLFSSDGSVGGQLHRSDTGAIADVLLLPYWFWGAVISAATLAILWWSFRIAFRR